MPATRASVAIERIVVTPEAMIAATHPAMNPFLTVVIEAGGGAATTIRMARWGDHVHPRAETACAYLADLDDMRPATLEARSRSRIIWQLADIPADLPSCGFQSHREWRDVRLVPDVYYYDAGGFETFRPAMVPWADRLPMAIWRGSSTGLVDLTVEMLGDLPRYRLCRLARDLGGRADCKLTDIAQAATPEDRALIAARTKAEGLTGPFMPLPQMARYRILVDIDGNANAWNLVAKMKLGCCLLKVESPWRQWLHDRLEPWTHFVPVRADLSDFAELIDWCLEHDREVQDIADRGRAFACSMRFTGELANASAVVFSAGMHVS